MPVRFPRPLFALALVSLVALQSLRADQADDPAVARMRAHLTFLASDACEGRGPGTAGIDKAADHIAAAFRAAGLKGALPDGSYFQPFTVRGSSQLGKDSGVILSSSDDDAKPLNLNGDQFQPMGLSG